MNTGRLYETNPDGYTQAEIDQEHIEYDDIVVRDALWGCALGFWSRRECCFGEGNGADAELFEDIAFESEQPGFIITMPDGSQYNVTVAQMRGPRWEQTPDALKS